jgi:E3 ubiquitin-protein ligase synoviolin
MFVPPPPAPPTATGAGSSSDSQPTFTPPPIFFGPPLPPFGMPFPSFSAGFPGLPGMSPPMPPPDYEGMTREELEALKGQEEDAIRNRITCLRNIQCLLDAAVLQMHQYAMATGTSL